MPGPSSRIVPLSMLSPLRNQENVCPPLQVSLAKTDACVELDLIALSVKCQKGQAIDTLNLLGIIHRLTGVFSEGRHIPH